MFGKILSSPKFYGTFWIFWFIVLWFLSGDKLPDVQGPEFPHIDKLLHWGYFGIGGAIATFCALSFSRIDKLSKKVFFILIALGLLIGGIDEYRQSFSPYRSGNDPYDLLADVFGTFCGIYSAQFIWNWAFFRKLR